MKEHEHIRHRVVTFLDREELDFLDEISKDILFSQGVKVPRSTILKHIVDRCLRENHVELIDNIVQGVDKENTDE